MPTGYTHKIYDNSGETFAEFVWHCARHFAAMYHLRDEDGGVPSLAQALSNNRNSAKWHASRLEESKTHLQELLALSPDEMEKRRLAEFERRLGEWRRAVSDKRALRQRYQDRLDEVKAWTPPTCEHDRLREFMIQQIEESIEWDCHDPEPPKELDLDAYRAEQIESATWSVGYHATEMAKAQANEVRRRAWIEALHASVPNPRG